MNRSILLAVILVTFAFALSNAQTPNYVQTDVYTNLDSVASGAAYTDGLGRQVQTWVDLGNTTGRYSVTYYDDAGRMWAGIIPFTVGQTGYYTGTMNDVISAATTQHGTYPYSEIIYKPDPLNRPDRVGAPGQLFSLDISGHFTRSWYFGTVRTDFLNDLTNVDKYGFAKDLKLSAPIIDGFETTDIITAGDAQTPNCFLTITKDPNDNYTQEIKDIFGRTVSKCSMLGVMSSYSYDILGNLLKESPPSAGSTATVRLVDDAMASTYNYNTLGQLEKKHTPDAGDVLYKYDAAGQLIASQNAKQADINPATNYTVYFYDMLGRNYAIGLNKTSTTFIDVATRSWQWSDIDPRIMKYFDSPGVFFTYVNMAPASLPATIDNVNGRLAVEVAYQVPLGAGNAIADPANADFWDNAAIDIYSYDEQGNVKAKMKHIPKMPARTFCLFTYTYDLQGNPITKVYAKNDQGASDNIDNLSYNRDRFGRINRSASPHGKLLDVVYNSYGELERKNFYSQTGTVADSISWLYDIHSWPTDITSGKGIFSEYLYYETLANPQYNGNISSVEYAYQAYGSGASKMSSYNYDKVNRLIAVTPQDAALYNTEAINYWPNGQIQSKKSGSQPVGTYQYYGNTNKLEKIQDRALKSGDHNFIYDPNGNMVLDCSKKMLVDYDWRDMPVSFKFFDRIPAAIQTPGPTISWKLLESTITNGGGIMKSEVWMAYDAGGNRVVKVERK